MRDIETLLKKTSKKIDPIIKKLLAYGVETRTRPLVFYQVEAGGKRLRPSLAILSCLACGGRARDVLYPAAGLEILHTYTLIVDDIIDHSEKRRGKPTTWKKFGRSFAECVSVDYGASVLEAAVRSRNPAPVAQLFGQTMKEIVDGEILDILFEQGGREEETYAVKNRFRKVTLKDYVVMIGKKSAFLFQTSCELGGLAAEASEKEISSLKKYGWHLGIAFQIIDDVLDIYGQKEFGKPKGQDIRERKLGNILTLLAAEELSPKQQKKVRQAFKKNIIKESDVSMITAYIKKTEAKEKALKLAQNHIIKAKKSLHSIKSSSYRDSLGQLAEFVLIREK